MDEEIKKCSICGRETNLSLKCHDCLELTQSFHKWIRSFKKDRKEMSKHELIIAMGDMVLKLSRIKTKTLSEWGIQ